MLKKNVEEKQVGSPCRAGSIEEQICVTDSAFTSCLTFSRHPDTDGAECPSRPQILDEKLQVHRPHAQELGSIHPPPGPGAQGSAADTGWQDACR